VRDTLHTTHAVLHFVRRSESIAPTAFAAAWRDPRTSARAVARRCTSSPCAQPRDRPSPTGLRLRRCARVVV
jgi:hypothetical protein